jgi:RND superfamily putative drug exporter
MHTTFAARAGRWSAEHRKTAIWGWLAFVLVAVVIGGVVGMKDSSQQTAVGDSGRADKVLDRAFPTDSEETVMVQAPRGGDVRDPAVRRAVGDVIAAVSGQPRVAAVESPYAPGNAAAQVSADRRSALVTFEVRGDEKEAEDAIAPVVAAVDRVQAQNPAVFVGQFGDASANKALSESFDEDFQKAEKLSLPITLAILVVAFGALVAAGIPLVLGLSAVMATLGLAAIPSHLIPMDESIASIILLIGMAVGVDYTLFYLRREREEKRRGAGKLEAVHTAAATSGRAVLVSGFTVMAAMAGLFLAGDRTFTSLGVGSIMVVAVAMIGSLTVVPATLAWLGDRVDKGRIPLLHRVVRRDGESRLWNAVLTRVLRRPAVSVAAATALLVVLALPALGMHTVLTGTDDLPRKLEVMRTYDRMQAAFPGGQIPAVVAVQADDVTTPRVRAAIAELERRAIATGTMNGPADVRVSADRTVASVQIPMKGDGTDDASNRAVEALRGEVVPATIGAVPGAKAYVTGLAAGSLDWNDLMKGRAPLVFAFVLTLAFLLMLMTFRSIVIPVKAIVLNLLSVAAAYGVLVWVFQDGHLEGLLGFQSNGGVVSWLPMFLFVILFGLSMDYHVFILSRVRELVDRGMRTEDAVAQGIKATAGTVTSAAAVMIAVFAIFATLSSLDFKQMGVGLSVAILIDATVVRAVLLPATMKLLGRWNWYFPRSLEWLPTLRHGEAEAAAAAEAARA